MDCFGVFLFFSAMFTLIFLAVAVRGQILYHNEIYTYQQQTIADMKEKLDTAERERDAFKCEFGHANQTIADMTGELSIVTHERDEAIAERNAIASALEKATKEREELQAKVCKQKNNDIELLNLKIYKERVLARLKSIIDDETDESFHS